MAEVAYTLDSLRRELEALERRGWVTTTRPGNDGGVGNTLEDYLGIQENNLSVADAGVFEIKAKRRSTTSLVSLFHNDPLPRKNPAIMTEVLLPKYGWPHRKAGSKYPADEMSFRGTLNSQRYTNRGFRVYVDKTSQQVRIEFNAAKVDKAKHGAWLAGVMRLAGPGDIAPACYWTREQLLSAIEEKAKNTIFVIADNRRRQHREEFHYSEAWLMTGITIDGFFDAVDEGTVFVDFDARSGHNHGTKFRIRSGSWPKLYANQTRIL